MLFTSYLLMMAIMMIPAGILASRVGDKRLMVTGLIIVTILQPYAGFLTTFLSFPFSEQVGDLVIRFSLQQL